MNTDKYLKKKVVVEFTFEIRLKSLSFMNRVRLLVFIFAEVFKRLKTET